MALGLAFALEGIAFVGLNLFTDRVALNVPGREPAEIGSELLDAIRA